MVQEEKIMLKVNKMNEEWRVRERKVTWKNGDILILYNVGKYEKFLFWTNWFEGKDFNDEKEAKDFCKHLNDGCGIISKKYLD